MLKRFHLKGHGPQVSYQPPVAPARPTAPTPAAPSTDSWGDMAAVPQQAIALDDNEFGKF